ncbi:hypothetical protein Ataiwa_06810 [Algoriphagus taiwanensis]|uniref:Uncharacterized protein n=1 Tax=Algoriphagus taiwanensis TaxID=1445656 RepID=A0ABQ6PWU1_9BACT|nr:hypothetical protein Ataiwa_06810 [Algoriphagus taiwanensis]
MQILDFYQKFFLNLAFTQLDSIQKKRLENFSNLSEQIFCLFNLPAKGIPHSLGLPFLIWE